MFRPRSTAPCARGPRPKTKPEAIAVEVFGGIWSRIGTSAFHDLTSSRHVGQGPAFDAAIADMDKIDKDLWR